MLSFIPCKYQTQIQTVFVKKYYKTPYYLNKLFRKVVNTEEYKS